MIGYTIRKIFHFEMAHMLSSAYSEGCLNIHGHSYILEVLITSRDLSADGMVMDFKRLKEIVTEKVLDRFDHSFVIQDERLEATTITDLQKMQPKEIVAVKYNPTAEKMAYDIYNRIFWELNREVCEMLRLVIRLHETATGYAEYDGGHLQ